MAKILVVDDEVGIRELLSDILYEEGHSVDLAENAQRAREIRADHRPDLVLLDIWMPDTDGISLLKEWDARYELDMPVIMMSGHATLETAMEATRIGAIDFLEKPISYKKLLKSVQDGLAQSEQIRIQRSVVRPDSPLHQGVLAANRAADPGYMPEIPENSVNPELDFTPEQYQSHLISSWGAVPLEQPLRDARNVFEKIYFEYHLAKTRHSMTRVSDRTGLERTHLYRKLRQLGLEVIKSRALLTPAPGDENDDED